MLNNEELIKIFQKIISNNFSQKDFESLLKFFKSELKYNIDFNYDENDSDRIDDILSEIIFTLVRRLKDIKNDITSEITNPRAYLREIIKNELYKYNVEYGRRYFNRILIEIITEMENSSILISYNNREKICLNGVNSGELDELEILDISNKYPITILSNSNRYTKEFKDSIKTFIINLLTETGCIKKTLLVDIISKKVGLKKTTNLQEDSDEDSQDLDDKRFKDINLSQDQLFMIKELMIEYKQKLENFIKTNPDKNLKVILAVYYHSYVKTTLEKIAELLNLNSPTTIHTWLTRNADLLPDYFIKNSIHKLIINEIEYEFIIIRVYDECLSILKDTLIEYGLLEK